MQEHGHLRTTVGVLPGYEVYEKAILLSFLDPLLHGIRPTARDRCSLMVACGFSAFPRPTGQVRPAWPTLAPKAGSSPVGPWSTDGLIVVNPLPDVNARDVGSLIAAGHPVVFVGTAEGGPAIGMDGEGGIRQALAHLAERLLEVGIRHAAVAFFAPDATDPPAWSILRAGHPWAWEPLCFPSRHFPPPELYAALAPLSPTLLPLIIGGELVGYLALDAASLELCGAIVQQLAVALYGTRLHHLPAGEPQPAPEIPAQAGEAMIHRPKLGDETQRLMRKATAYIHEHYAEPISREDVARHVGVNKDYLTRCFSRMMGVPLVAYLNRYRVSQAKTLLAACEKSVAQVAAAVGFSDASYFCRVFRQEAGMPPSAYGHPRKGAS